MVILWIWFACATDNPAPVSDAAVHSGAVLTRASLDLRGIRPSEADLDQVEADESTIEELALGYMHDARFGDRVVEMYGEVFLTHAERFGVAFESFDLEPIDRPKYFHSIGEEPLRLLAHIAENDLPYTDLVTADWTMANELLGAIYPLDYPTGDTGWQTAHYTDGRPAAGILSTNGMWWRYTSTSSNLNRKRANQVSRILLCNDYLSRPIDFNRDVNLLDEDAVADAIQNNPGCVNCHVSLDPIASYLYGFWYIDPESAADATVYHPEREQLWIQKTGIAPGYYGEAGTNLTDLGHKIAADPRFVECAVEHAFTRLMGRDVTLGDSDALTVHREAFLESGLSLRSLFHSIVTHPRYQSGPDALPGHLARKMVTADQLASQIEALTGYRWTSNGYDMLQTDEVGLGNLAGRADGYRMARNNTEPNATMLLVQERLAENAAVYAVIQEIQIEPAERTLFTEINFSETPSTNKAAMVAQVRALHRRVFGQTIEKDGLEVEANLDLWLQLYAASNVQTSSSDATIWAWAGLLSALFRDPDFLLY